MGESVSYDARVLPKNLETSENKQGDDLNRLQTRKECSKVI